jgi:hypothetical protein
MDIGGMWDGQHVSLADSETDDWYQWNHNVL